jgi:hypothetical protein
MKFGRTKRNERLCLSGQGDRAFVGAFNIQRPEQQNALR